MLTRQTVTRLSLYSVLLLPFFACMRKNPGTRPQPSAFRRNEVILVYPPDISQNQRLKIHDSILARYPNRSVRTCVCDPTMEIITAENVHQTVGGDSSSVKTPTSTRAGIQGGEVILSKNLLFQQPVQGKAREVTQLLFRKARGNVRIVVIDTGLDTTGRFFSSSALSGFLLPASAANYGKVGITNPGSISGNRFFGWNFLNDTQDFTDDNAGLHGTNVTGLILSKLADTAAWIIPLKAFGADGLGTLFDIRCALKFAELAGANIVNASWGYNGYADNDALRQSISSLERKNILLVASAGNDGNSTDVVRHFPGSFSHSGPDGLSNVITVTTATTGGICRNSNFSRNLVDLGVAGSGEICGFVNPFEAAGGPRINGTSYAAAIFTGIIANRYASRPFTAPIRDNVLPAVLSSQPASPLLIDRVKTSKRLVQ